MSEQVDLLRTTWPVGVRLDAFLQAYELHRAAAASLRFRADNSLDSTKSDSAYRQREALLEIISQLLINERNKQLDLFVVSWAKARNLQLSPNEN